MLTRLNCWPACVLLIAAHFSQAARAEGIWLERVFGPEVKTGDYKHPACLTELDSGELYLAYYGGAGEYADETKVFGSRRPRGKGVWTEPQVIASSPVRSLGNPVVWQAPDGIVWLFYVTRFGKTWSTSRIDAKISRDGAATWSDSFLLTLEAGTMVRGQPIVLSNGDYLLPIYLETGADPELTGADTTSRFLRKCPDSMEWTESGVIHSDRGNLQPAVVELDDRHLLAFCRRAGDYLPTTKGWIVMSQSRDGGLTWSRGVDTQFPNPNSAIDLKRLRNGHLLLVYNDSMSERTPLTMAVSTDDGQTFPHRRNLAEGTGDFAYPTAIQTRDGQLHIVFTSDERTVIQHAVLDEQTILGQR